MLMLRNAAVLAYFIWIFIDGAVVFRYKTSKVENRDRFSLQVVMIGNMLAGIIGISLAYSTLGSMHSMLLQALGLVVMGIGIGVRSMAIAQLGRFHSPNVAIREDHQLMQNGLYRYVRHPSYLGALIAFLGFSLALGNWLSLVVIMVITPCIYLYRIHEEEAVLADAFGETYRAYRRQTSRLIPGVY